MYRFGFNGMEKDDEWSGQSGATYDYGFRIYDSRIARFLSVDPLAKSYPWYTPYQFAGNMPIWAIDLDGLEPLIPPSMRINGGLKLTTEAQVKATVGLFKLGFSERLPKKFIEHYAYAKGKEYDLSQNEMAQCNVRPMGLGSKSIRGQVMPKIENLQPGESIYFDEIKTSSAGANTSGTLGQFTIKVRGTFTMGENGKYTFDGEMQFYDEWDFNVETEAEEKARKQQTGGQRSAMGKSQTEFANEHLPGEGFPIESDWVKVTQTEKDKHFSWFKGKDSSSKPNRLSKTKQETSR